jgi:parallel beta-helix repeat protein
VNNISIKNLTLTASWNGTYSTDTAVNNPGHGGPDYGLMLHTYSNSVVATYNIFVENVTVEKFINAGLNAGTGCHDVVFKNCTARNATDVGGGGCGYGFQLCGFFPGNGLASNPHLGTARDHYFNLVDGCRTTGPYIRHGVVIQYWSHNNLVTNCDFTDTRIDAIDLHGEDEYNNEIAYNTVANCPGESGIGAGNGGGGGAVLHDKAGPHNFIHHNTVVNCRYGITVQYNTPYTRVENNTISGFSASGGRGIRLGNAPYTTVADNIVQNNTGTGYCGFLLFSESAMGVEPGGSPVHCTITGNSVLDNPNGAAFQINAGSQNVFSGNTASGNAINVLP